MGQVAFEYMEWVVSDDNGWRLKEDAPDNVVKAFNEYMNESDCIGPKP